MSKLAQAIMVTPSQRMVHFNSRSLFNEVVNVKEGFTNFDCFDSALVYMVEARFRAETAIPYDCNDVIHEEHVKAAKRKIVEAVFGEFRPFFIQINSELFNRNFERARELIREMEDSMFESSEPE